MPGGGGVPAHSTHPACFLRAVQRSFQAGGPRNGAMPIRVLVLITDLNTGGVPLHVWRLTASLDPAEFDVCVGCLSPRGTVSALLEGSGVRTFSCDAVGPWDLRGLWRLGHRIRSERPNVLHALLFHANTAACLVGPLVGVGPRRILAEIQTVEIERRWHLTIGGATCRMCRYVIGNSPTVIDHLRRRAHIPASRLKLIPGGVDVRRFADARPIDREGIGVPADAPLLLWVGRFDPVKGLDELVEAVNRLNDPQVYLVLAGEGCYERAVRERVAELGLGDRVRFLGRREDVPALLAAADLFVFPSRTEGLPNALLEAMAAAKPIVTTDVPGCGDLITDGQTGLLAPARNPEALSRCMRRLIDDRDLAARLGRAAREHAVRRYDFRATTAAYAALYRTIAADS